MSRFLAALLDARGWKTAALSLDDLYLTRKERARLAETVHPLLAVRGVPGTHDVDLGLEILEALFEAEPGDCTRMPRFDKAADTRAPATGAHDFEGPADIVVFEGWCVGAEPQDPALLDEPINHLDIPSRSRFEQALGGLTSLSGEELMQARYEKFRRIGKFLEGGAA